MVDILGRTECLPAEGVKPGRSHEHFYVGRSGKLLKEISEGRDLIFKAPLIC